VRAAISLESTREKKKPTQERRKAFRLERRGAVDESLGDKTGFLIRGEPKIRTWESKKDTTLIEEKERDSGEKNKKGKKVGESKRVSSNSKGEKRRSKSYRNYGSG